MRMIRISVCLLLALALAVCPLSGCSKQPPVNIPVKVEGAIFGGASDDRIVTNLVFDPDWITKASETKYNAELAAFSALLCADSYFREKDLDKGTQNRVLPESTTPEAYSFPTLLGEVGFTDVRHVESFKLKEYPTDTNDSVTLTLAYCTVGKKYDAYIVVVRGCFSAQEWVSTFDPGCDGKTYTDLTGTHEEWTDKSVCKGFGIAAARALEIVQDYMKEHDDPGRKDCVLVTGHSRGGAIAYLLGAKVGQTAKTFTYTFNAPAVVDKDSVTVENDIFNLFDEGDFYADPLPFGDEPLSRVGKDMKVSVADNREILNEIKYLKGRSDYVSTSAELRAAYREQFGDRFKDRTSLYVMRSAVEAFATREEAEERAALLQSFIDPTGLDLGLYVKLGELQTASDGSCALTINYCDAALLAGYAKLLAYGQPACDAFKTLFASDAKACGIADLLIQNQAALSGGHLLINSYVLTSYVK